MKRPAVSGGGLVGRPFRLAREPEPEEAERHLRQVLTRAPMSGLGQERLPVAVGGGARPARSSMQPARYQSSAVPGQADAAR
ncbi:MAG: hypothetical protein EXQ95_12365 [Alphaproteobacteria bacterium]|nr:hypothetical protein [Alphaproteobacteria bacterium]